MDDLCSWLGTIHAKLKIHKECLEYQAHLIEECRQPWPLETTPQNHQDMFRQETTSHEIVPECAEVSELDKDLRSVENLLNKARLLHERTDGRSNTTGRVKSSTKAKKHEVLSDNNSKCEKQPQRKETQRNKISKPKSAPLKKTSGSFQTTYKKDFGNRQRASTKPKNSTVRAASPLIVEEKQPTRNRKEPTIAKRAEPAEVPLHERTNPAMQMEIYPKQPSIDVTKVKLDFNKFVEDLEVPAKTKKLVKSFEKLKDSSLSNLLREDSCEEESSFMQNLSSSLPRDRPNECLPTFQTLQAANNQLEQCLVLCNKCEAVLKNQQNLSPSCRSSKVRWTEQQQIYLEKETHKLIKEFFHSLSKKFKQISLKTTVIGTPFKETKLDDDVINRLASEMRDLKNSADHIPYPASSLSYQSAEELSHWAHEKQKLQSLVIEKNVLKQIAKVFIPVIAKTVVDSKDEKQSTRPEVVSLLKNAYGLLAQKDLLLPAFVVAE